MVVTLVDEYGVFAEENDLILVRIPDNDCLDPECTVGQLELTNGTHVILF